MTVGSSINGAKARLIAASALLCLPATGGGPACADIIHVPGDHDTIQQAINAADAGDEIIVSPGTYHESIGFFGKAITVRSSDGPQVTTIDATDLQASVVRCVHGEGPATVLDGFRITRGTGTYFQHGATIGGGIFICAGGSPTIENCILVANAAGLGGGLACYEAGSPSIRNCTLAENAALLGGAMLFLYGHPTVSDCTFINNRVAYEGGVGGGIYDGSESLELSRCVFDANSCGGIGGGLFTAGHDTTVLNCIFRGNDGSDGGAIYYDGIGLSIINCLFNGNVAVGEWGPGGGLYACNYFPEMVNCTFVANSARFGSAMYYYFEVPPPAGGHAPITASASFRPTKRVDGFAVANCVVWGNEPPQVCFDLDIITVDYSDIEGGWHEGEGNLNADPLFADPLGPDGLPGTNDDDLRLRAGSPCIDAGDNTAVPPDVLDLDDDGDTQEPTPFDLDDKPRFVDDPHTQDTGHGDGPITDMGAYEFQPPECPADFDDDGDVDTADLLYLLGAWGTPDGDVDSDGDTDTSDLLALLGAWGDCP